MNPLLRAHNLTFAYRDTPVLRDVSLSLSPGQIIALLGPNGSGKSTLLKLLTGHLRATGAVLWEDRPIRSWPRRELARRIAYLPQSPTHLPEQTVLDVLRLGRAPYWQPFGLESPRDQVVLQETARLLDLTDLLSRRLDELSGGQRQRVFLARCLAQEPRALLLDEPNTFLDLRHQVELAHRLRQLAREQNLAILLASHDLNLAAAFADRIILLHDGVIAAQGVPDEVMRPDLLSRVYEIPIETIPRDARPPVVIPRIDLDRPNPSHTSSDPPPPPPQTPSSE